MRPYLLYLGIACCILASCDQEGAQDAQPIPAISALTPDYGMAGDTIVISGTNFGTTTSDVKVNFPNNKAGMIIAQTDTTLTVITPAESMGGPMTISVKGQEVITPDFTFYSLYMFGATKEVWKYQATVWKDGKPTIYSEEYSSILEGLVVNGDVYAIGYRTPTNGDLPAFWKNGVLVDIPGTTVNTDFTGISVSNGDVFISGMEHLSTYQAIPVYWKNGAKTVLAEGEFGEYSRTTDIQVYGSDVYVTGETGALTSEGVYSLPCYWKNNAVTFLSNFGNDATTAITVVGADTFITGTRLLPNGSLGLLWKNGVGTILEPVAGNNYYRTSSILVSGSDVYVGGGWSIINTYQFSAKFWKNGVEHTIESPQAGHVPCISEYRGDIFMTISSNTFNSYSEVFKNGRPIFSSDEYHERVLSHQLVEY